MKSPAMEKMKDILMKSNLPTKDKLDMIDHIFAFAKERIEEHDKLFEGLPR